MPNYFFEPQELQIGVNDKTFKIDDKILISEHIEGIETAIQFDVETQTLKGYAADGFITEENDLWGFYKYMQNLPVEDFIDSPHLVMRGTWLGLSKDKIIYYPTSYKKWYIHDLYGIRKHEWKNPTLVKGFCFAHDLPTTQVLYSGPFISWDHCKSFLGSSAYGRHQKGIIVKNISQLKKLESEKDNIYLRISN